MRVRLFIILDKRCCCQKDISLTISYSKAAACAKGFEANQPEFIWHDYCII
ncbi:hypothetical protein [Desulfosporosinus sp. OT]|uniref:hypothetical protein n=1 Tax=Desulfosporosinus sp. OT TaxID=913865 RepID=UPI000223AF31|nr:hypothetical protein [Desulfosporosinus sp. OT]EGW38869.1 hypothetical protein DOT_3220 [Desulfosporosinus sp. OT]